MKRILFFIAALFFCIINCFSQDIEGEWSGYFTDKSYSYSNSEEIIFIFIKKNDSTYEGYSKTFLRTNKISDSAICILRGGFAEKNILYLEEVKTIKQFAGGSTETCLQFMKLKFYITKKQFLLRGDWYTEGNTCGFGNIQLSKSNK